MTKQMTYILRGVKQAEKISSTVKFLKQKDERKTVGPQQNLPSDRKLFSFFMYKNYVIWSPNMLKYKQQNNCVEFGRN